MPKITDIKDRPFQERASEFEKEIKPFAEKWGVVPWAGLQQTNELIAAVPQLKDLWEKKDGVQPAKAA